MPCTWVDMDDGTSIRVQHVGPMNREAILAIGALYRAARKALPSEVPTAPAPPAKKEERP